ncbi:MAG: hypothetical protein N2645_13885 [Clostridia bacterium]|nr:hypothetical protein [Clostridia bacterium]
MNTCMKCGSSYYENNSKLEYCEACLHELVNQCQGDQCQNKITRYEEIRCNGYCTKCLSEMVKSYTK